jgi:hypothetical protein
MKFTILTLISLLLLASVSCRAQWDANILPTPPPANTPLLQNKQFGLMEYLDTNGVVHFSNLAVDGTVTANSSSLSARRKFIPVGVTFWDDFSRNDTAQPKGGLGTAPSVNPATGKNYVWYAGGNSGFTRSNFFIINQSYGWKDLRTAGSSDAAYPTIDVGFKPTYFGCQYHLSTNAGASGSVQMITFISESTDQSLSGAIHITLIPNGGLGVQFWGSSGPTNVLGSPTTFSPPGWAGVQALGNGGSGGTFQCWIDGAQATFDLSGYTFTYYDTAFTNFGGRYLTFELFDAGVVGTTNLDNIFIDAVWAGANPRATQNTYGNNDLNSPPIYNVPVDPLGGVSSQGTYSIGNLQVSANGVSGLSPGQGIAGVIYVPKSGFYSRLYLDKTTTGNATGPLTTTVSIYAMNGNAYPTGPCLAITTNFLWGVSSANTTGIGLTNYLTKLNGAFLPAGLYWVLSASSHTGGQLFNNGAAQNLFAPVVLGNQYTQIYGTYTTPANPSSMTNASLFSLSFVVGDAAGGRWPYAGVAP